MITLFLGLAVFSTSALSAIVGMAGGLILKGVLIALSPVATAMVIHGFTQAIANGYRAFRLRHSIDWNALRFYLRGALLSLVIFSLVQWVPSSTGIYFGLGILPFLSLLVPTSIRPDFAHPRVAQVTGFLVNGTQLLAGVAGPLLDLAFVETRYSKSEVVATKAATQTVSHLMKLGCYSWILIQSAKTSDEIVSSAAMPEPWLLALCAGVSILVTSAGARVLERLHERPFKSLGRFLVLGIGSVYLLLGAQRIIH
jgi:uncharacterized membrane protein YfcA